MGSDDLFKKAKARRHQRKVGKKGKPKDLILIVCEGEQTEPNYFENFKLTNVDIDRSGYNTDSLVNRAIELKKQAKKYGKIYNQVWCVFDRDSFKPQNFNNAIFLAEKNNIKVAYSNEAFELWYLLHFHFYDTGISRKDYCKKLDKLLCHKYEKNSKDIYDELLERQGIAIKNAQKLLAQHLKPNPEKNNPSTTVHLLVEELNKWLK